MQITKTNQKKLLKKYKNKLKEYEKEKNYIKEDSILKLKDIELEVLEVINQFKSLELKVLNKKISKKELFTYMSAILNSLKLEIITSPIIE